MVKGSGPERQKASRSEPDRVYSTIISNLPLKRQALFFSSVQRTELVVWFCFRMASLAFPPNICIWPSISLQSPPRLLDALSCDYGLNPFISNPRGCSLSALQLKPLHCPQSTDLEGKGVKWCLFLGRRKPAVLHASHFFYQWRFREQLTDQEAPPAMQVYCRDAATLLHTKQCHVQGECNDYVTALPPSSAEATAMPAPLDRDRRGNHFCPSCPWDAVFGLHLLEHEVYSALALT